MKYLPVQTSRPVRRVSVKVRAKYSLYKTELREDFVRRCGYCDTLDYYSGGKNGFHIDHFAPKSKFSHLENEYTNLIYACPVCNIGKSDDWPGNDPLISFSGDIGYVDPCHPSYHDHLGRADDGRIIALTGLGRYIHKRLKLSLRRRQICWLVEQMEIKLNQLDQLIEKNGVTNSVAELDSFRKLTREYIRYIGVLKSE